jgi:transcriptional regulator GlxA family with amidase domain
LCWPHRPARRAARDHHWRHAERLAHRHPQLEVDADPIWIRAGRFYTSAGVTAGMDLSLALVEEDLGHAVSLDVARELVLFLRRPAIRRSSRRCCGAGGAKP